MISKLLSAFLTKALIFSGSEISLFSLKASFILLVAYILQQKDNYKNLLEYIVRKWWKHGDVVRQSIKTYAGISFNVFQQKGNWLLQACKNFWNDLCQTATKTFLYMIKPVGNNYPHSRSILVNEIFIYSKDITPNKYAYRLV